MSISSASLTEHLLPTWQRWLDRVPRWGVAGLVCLAPAIVTGLLLYGYLRVDLRNFLPINWNDQTYLWHQILTFREVGFSGGYYAFHEQTGALTNFRFGASGSLYPAFYGSIARLVGWEPYTGILINALLLALGMAVWLYLARLDRLQMLLSGLAVLAIGPILMFIPTISQEAIHQAGALVLAGLFCRLLRGREGLSRPLMLLGVSFLIFIALMRFSWTLLLPPFFLLMQRNRTRRSLLRALDATVVITALVLVVFQQTSAPGNNSIFNRLDLLAVSPAQGVQYLWEATQRNINTSFFAVEDSQTFTTDTLQGIQFALTLIASLVLLLRGRSADNRTSERLTWGFQTYNLAMILLVSLVVYISDGYYRVLGLHLLLTLLVLIADRRFYLVSVIIFSSALTWGTFLHDYRQWVGDNFPSNHQALAAVQPTFREHLVYVSSADPWCNTLLVPARFLDERILAVPGGIGVSFFTQFDNLTLPLRSHYLLLDDDLYTVWHDQLRVEQLAATPLGTLYRNLDARCP
jgi:hypothetical protein